MGNKVQSDHLLYSVKYSCTSILDDSSPDCFSKYHFGEIYEIDSEANTETLIGKINLRVLLIGSALNAHHDLEELFNVDEDTYQIGKQIYNFEAQSINEDIDEFYGSIYISQICIIDRLELQEKYRGMGIALKVIKDLYIQFESDSCLIIAQMIPAQFESGDNRSSKWKNAIAINKLDEDFEKSYFKLKALFQNFGFDHIEGYDDLMFLSSENRNEILNG